MVRPGPRRRGFTLALVVAVLSFALVVVVAWSVSSTGVAALDVAQASVTSRRALYAAEAGAGAALRELASNAAWSAGFPATAFGTEGTSYQVEVVNNYQGAAARSASNGASVPVGCSYVLSTGHSGRISRRVGVMTKVGFSFAYGIATTKRLFFQGPIVEGSIKSGGDIQFRAITQLVPRNGNGSLLSAGLLDNSSISMAAGQVVRARGSITRPGSVSGTSLVYANDTSADSLPFLYDGRTDNRKSAGEQGEVFPNPSAAALLAPGKYTDHGATTTISTSFNLGGRIHYFPNGVRFDRNAVLSGQGTIVVGNGKSAVFETPIGTKDVPMALNVVALDSKPGQVGTSLLSFKAEVNAKGLFYSHGTFTADSRFVNEGVTLAVGDMTLLHGSVMLKVAAPAVAVPGFEPWFGQGASVNQSNAGALEVTSWQRF